MSGARTLTTRADSPDSLLSVDGSSPDVLTLTVLWSREEPARVGAVTCVPRGGGAPWVLGRAGGDGPRRLSWVRQRPGGDEDLGELQSPRVSREHLRLRADGQGLALEAVGHRAVKVNTRAVSRARVLPGDLVEIDRELLLLCERRPARLPPASAAHPFGSPDADGLVGESVAAWDLRRQLAFCAATSGHVLVRGESGAGKELVARALHRLGGAGGSLVARNAATFPEGLLDAELFGNLRGYPNPGMPARPGAIGEADGGTLFLDEIGEISHAMQAHLLRVLDQGEYQRLGEARARVARFRLIGATNRPPESLKHDFLARFSQTILVPGLNLRRADIPLIARHLLVRFGQQTPGLFEGAPPRLHPRLVQRLVLHPWGTHVRELGQLLWRALQQWTLKGGGKYLDLKEEPASPAAAPQPAPPPARPDPAAVTREEILAAYRRFGGVQARVPAHLGLRDRFQLRRLEEKLGITPADKEAALADGSSKGG
ncbi:MAG: sigma-54-dependent Fis family transcriptional regulator [Alphaproteobacteria bacterium]|nr:sigma-54-dependent Fis family transcriptional regulator [Alphaproteobacteria bacterium]